MIHELAHNCNEITDVWVAGKSWFAEYWLQKDNTSFLKTNLSKQRTLVNYLQTLSKQRMQ